MVEMMWDKPRKCLIVVREYAGMGFKGTSALQRSN
jgi:hypothetical protein